MTSAVDKGNPGESRVRKATGPRSPPRRRLTDAAKVSTTAELPNGQLGSFMSTRGGSHARH